MARQLYLWRLMSGFSRFRSSTIYFHTTTQQGVDRLFEHMKHRQPFTTTISLQNVTIESAKVSQLEIQQAQLQYEQKINDNRTLSLTYIVLFLAYLDISFIFYQIEKDSQNKTKQEKR